MVGRGAILWLVGCPPVGVELELEVKGPTNPSGTKAIAVAQKPLMWVEVVAHGWWVVRLLGWCPVA